MRDKKYRGGRGGHAANTTVTENRTRKERTKKDKIKAGDGETVADIGGTEADMATTREKRGEAQPNKAQLTQPQPQPVCGSQDTPDRQARTHGHTQESMAPG